MKPINKTNRNDNLNAISAPFTPLINYSHYCVSFILQKKL